MLAIILGLHSVQIRYDTSLKITISSFMCVQFFFKKNYKFRFLYIFTNIFYRRVAQIVLIFKMVLDLNPCYFLYYVKLTH